MWSSHKISTGRLLRAALSCCWLLIIINYVNVSEAQISPIQQIHFVPKTYFLQQQQQQQQHYQMPQEQSAASQSSQMQSAEPAVAETVMIASPTDITRNPRHLAPDRYYVGPPTLETEQAVADQAATATTNLRTSTLDRAGNPVDFNPELEQELKLDISNDNPHNNQFEAKILPHNSASSTQSIVLRKSNRGKIRRAKTRPPKNAIIYSFPEQSFYATGSGDETSYSEPDSRENNSGLRSDLGDGRVIQEQESVADSKEFRTNSINTISEKKTVLAQCMAQCIDAIL